MDYQQRYQRRNQRYLKTNKHEDTTIQNLWDTENATLREKFPALQFLSEKNKKKLN